MQVKLPSSCALCICKHLGTETVYGKTGTYYHKTKATLACTTLRRACTPRRARRDNCQCCTAIMQRWQQQGMTTQATLRQNLPYLGYHSGNGRRRSSRLSTELQSIWVVYPRQPSRSFTIGQPTRTAGLSAARSQHPITNADSRVRAQHANDKSLFGCRWGILC